MMSPILTNNRELYMKSSNMNELFTACEAAEIPVYRTDFLCRVLAILYCYGGGPGSEHFRAPVGHFAAMKAGAMLDEAIRQKKWYIVKKFQTYVKELQANNAIWLKRTLDKLNIPVNEIKFSECLQSKSAKGA